VCSIIAVVLALVSPLLAVVLGVVSLVLAYRADQAIRASEGALGGQGLVKTARLTGAAAIVFAFVNYAIVLAFFPKN